VLKGTKKLVAIIMIILLITPITALAIGNLPIPTGLNAQPINSSEIQLTWNRVNSANEYYIYRATQLNGPYTFVDSSKSTSYTDKALSPQTLYYYKVQAISGNAVSDHTASVYAVTFATDFINNEEIRVSRLSGKDRYQTAAEIAKAGWNNSYYAVLASGENFPDALCAAPLAGKYNAPILLTAKNNLPAETREQLLNLNVKKVFIVGGNGVVSDNVLQIIKNLGIDVIRLAGSNRYDTSVAVAKELGDFNEAFIASGLNFQDVLSAAPIAAKKGIPILLTPKDSMSKELETLLSKNINKIYILGDSGVISDKVFSQLRNSYRITGTNWYDMNINIINNFAEFMNFDNCYIATGNVYPDALAGSVYASLSAAPVILVQDLLDKSTQEFFEKNSFKIMNIVAFGGTGVVSDSLLDKVKGFINSKNNNLIITNLTATPQNASQIRLNWSNVTDATAYHIFRSMSYNGAYTRIATVTVPYYVDYNLVTGGTYYYKVQAAQNAVLGEYSNIVYATTYTASSDLAQPNNVNATVVNPNQVNLTWNSVSNALYYNVYRATSADGQYAIIASVSTPYYADTGLTTGISYYYKIQALNNNVVSPYSSVVQVYLSNTGTVLSAPINVRATPLNSTQVYLDWNSVNNATYYNVYRSTSINGPDSLIASVTSNFYLDNSLTPGTTYFYKIQAGNTQGVGAYSNVVLATLTNNISNLVAPTNVKANTLSTTQIYLTWDIVPNATYYTVYRSTSSTGDFSIIGAVSTPYFTDSNCSSKTTYYYKIQAGNNTATGPASIVIAGTTN